MQSNPDLSISGLKPCPFCEPGVMCECEVHVSAEKWNTRPIEAALEAENARLREALGEIRIFAEIWNLRTVATMAKKTLEGK